MFKFEPNCLIAWSCGVVVITSALHAEGPRFDPGRDQLAYIFFHQSPKVALALLLHDYTFYKLVSLLTLKCDDTILSPLFAISLVGDVAQMVERSLSM